MCGGVIGDRVKFCIGLVCGHLKSTRFAELFAWQMGIKPHELQTSDFRTKLNGFDANQYGVTIRGIVGGEVIVKTSPPTNNLYGTNWGHGLFKCKACDYCDEVVAETADITIGDAWLPRYIRDSKGTNILVVRNHIIKSLIKKAPQKGIAGIDIIQAKDVIKAQDAGFRHRRGGLAYRLANGVNRFRSKD